MKRRTRLCLIAAVLVCGLLMSGILPIGYYWLRNKVLAHWGWCSPDDTISVVWFRWFPGSRLKLAIYLANPGGVVQLPNGYSETETGNLTLKANVSINCGGQCTINLNGTNQILAPATATNVSLNGIEPWPTTSIGADTGFSIKGYTGTAAAVSVGTSGTQGQTFSMTNVYVDNTASGAGAAGIQIVGVTQCALNSIWVYENGSTNNQVGVTLDGDGGVSRFTTCDLNNVRVQQPGGGGGTGAVGARVQNGVTHVNVSSGEVSLNAGTGTAGYDITGSTTNGVYFWGPNCEQLVTVLTVEATETFVVGGWIRSEGGSVTNFVNAGVGTNGDKVTFYGQVKTVIDAGTLNSWITDDQLQINTRMWQQQESASLLQWSSSSLSNQSGAQISMIPGGNITLDSNAGGGAGILMGNAGVVLCSRNSTCTFGNSGSGWPHFFLGPQGSANSTQFSTNATAPRGATFPDATGTVVLNPAPNNLTQRLTADATPIAATTPGTTVFTFGAIPANVNVSFHCEILYNQQTATGGVGLSVQGATNAPTRLDGWGNIFTSNAGVAVEGNAANITNTTATSVVTGTPSAITTVFQATLNGTIQVGASASTLNILMYTGAGADTVTPKAGSFCTLQP